MGLFDSIFGRKPNDAKQLNGYWKTLTAYTPTFRSWGGNLYESELVRSAIDARARHMSKLSIELLGNAKPKLKTILKKAPNGFQTWAQFLYRTSTILDMQNTAFIVPMIDQYGETSGIFTILPSATELLQDKSGNPWLRYRFMNGQYASIELNKVGVMTKFQYKDDVFGSTNVALSDTMSLIDMQNQGIKEAIKNSATYRFMAQANNFVKSSDLAKERQRFSEENFSNEANGGGLLLFPNTYTNIKQIEATPFTIDSAQMDIIQKNVFNYFGVNEDILQNKAYGDSWSAFYEGCIEVFALQFSEVLTKMLYTDIEQAYGAGVIATSNRLQYLSNADKLSVSSQMADRGIMTRNEIRQIWNLPPIDGGDQATIRGEYYLLNDDGTTTKQNGGE